MNYLRLSLMTPRARHRHEATRLLAQIVAQCSRQPGYRGGMITAAGGGAQRRVGRLTLWADRTSADRAAADPHMLALRAALNAIVHEEGRLEFALDGVALSAEPGGEVGLTSVEAIRIAEGFVGGRSTSAV